MNEKFAPIREKLLACYGMDINEAKCFFSTMNYVFTFETHSSVIRVSTDNSKSRKELLSEYMFLDDLKQFADSICEPQLSLNLVPIEEFLVEGVYYRATMFRCAKGKAKTVSELEPIHIINIGDFLGRIHAGSMDAAKAGFVYQRKFAAEMVTEAFGTVRRDLPPTILERVEETLRKVRELPKDPSCFGMIHGDFHMNNFFLDGNNVWTFDFDDCGYFFYLYDIAALCHSWLMYGYHLGSGKTSREVLEQDILPYIKLGYELHMSVTKEQWEILDLLIEFRFATTAIALFYIKESGFLPDLELARQFVCFPLTQPDMLTGFDILLNSENNIFSQ